MLTFAHGASAHLFSRCQKKKWWFTALLVCFAMFPDYPMVIAAGNEFVKYFYRHPEALTLKKALEGADMMIFQNEIPPSIKISLANSWRYHRAALFTRCLHSIFFWAMLSLLAWPFMRRFPAFRNGFAPCVMGAGFFHIFLDFLTHKTNAHSYLWPFYNRPIAGLVAGNNPDFLDAQKVMVLIWFAYLLYITVRFFLRKMRPTVKYARESTANQ